jgi:hypothetical protein
MPCGFQLSSAVAFDIRKTALSSISISDAGVIGNHLAGADGQSGFRYRLSPPACARDGLSIQRAVTRKVEIDRRMSRRKARQDNANANLTGQPWLARE